ncbi:hypothetical protein OV203_18335 [Nannocystis sp. ILAH1]|nr:hypothetical protein [Nannocystis sp. ILAH1]MCY0989101.1 hypothetical protein [Nannocystis sp. ILAH1]
MHRRFAIPFVALLAACGSGPSAEEAQAFWSAYESLGPIRSKLAAVEAALPAPGSETSVACAPRVATSKLATIHFAQLEYLLEKPTQVEQWERMNLTEEGFQRMWNKADAQNTLDKSSAPTSEAAGLRVAAETLAPVDTLVVFRSSRIEPGELGDSPEPGVQAIVRDARWEGWALVYRFADQPVLEGAFPVAASNGAEVSRVIPRGTSLAAEDLLHDAMRRLEEQARARLSVPGCPASE